MQICLDVRIPETAEMAGHDLSSFKSEFGKVDSGRECYLEVPKESLNQLRIIASWAQWFTIAENKYIQSTWAAADYRLPWGESGHVLLTSK